MAVIQFENGTKVQFDGEPTAKDVEEVAQKLGIGKKKGSGNLLSQVGNDASVGLAKGVLSTLQGLSKLGQRFIIKPLAGGLTKKIAGKDAIPSSPAELPSKFTVASGPTQRIAKGMEQAAEFFVPAGAATRAVKFADTVINAAKLETLGKAGNFTANLLKLASRSAISATEGGGVTAAQTGGDKQQVKAAAMISGAVPMVGALVSSFARGGSKLATELETKLLKPGKSDIKEGFNINTIKKYDLGGSLEQTAKKLDDKFSSLGKQLKSATSVKGIKVNVSEAIDAVEKELTKMKTTTFGSNAGIQKALDSMRGELQLITRNGTVSLENAQRIKQAIGKLGAWQHGSPDPNASAVEAVANSLYRKLKVSIEKASPADVKAINKQFAELLPIERVLIRRIPVAARQSALSLGDLVGGVATLVNHPMGAAMFVTNKLLKSGQVIRGAQKASDAVIEAGNKGIGKLILGSSGVKSAVKTGGTRLQKVIRAVK